MPSPKLTDEWRLFSASEEPIDDSLWSNAEWSALLSEAVSNGLKRGHDNTPFLGILRKKRRRNKPADSWTNVFNWLKLKKETLKQIHEILPSVSITLPSLLNPGMQLLIAMIKVRLGPPRRQMAWCWANVRLERSLTRECPWWHHPYFLLYSRVLVRRRKRPRVRPAWTYWAVNSTY